MDERWVRGLCFNCDEPYNPHQCKKLLWLEGINEGDRDELPSLDLTGPKISLHAISGTHNAQTMQVMSEISTQAVRILINSGSAHYFLDYELALRLGIPFSVHTGLWVVAANGCKLQCMGVAYCVVLLSGQIFHVDIFCCVLAASGPFSVSNSFVLWVKLIGT